MTTPMVQENSAIGNIFRQLLYVIKNLPNTLKGMMSIIFLVVGIILGTWLLSSVPFVKDYIASLEFVQAVAMVCGILAKEIWDNINDTGEVGIRFARLMAALIVAPIVYSTVREKFAPDANPTNTVNTIVATKISLNLLAIAFQQGFFWQAVFRTVSYGTQKSVERQQAGHGTPLDKQTVPAQLVGQSTQLQDSVSTVQPTTDGSH